MNTDNLKLGIALSGGGIRATIIHLGVFKYLAEKGCLVKWDSQKENRQQTLFTGRKRK